MHGFRQIHHLIIVFLDTSEFNVHEKTGSTNIHEIVLPVFLHRIIQNRSTGLHALATHLIGTSAPCYTCMGIAMFLVCRDFTCADVELR